MQSQNFQDGYNRVNVTEKVCAFVYVLWYCRKRIFFYLVNTFLMYCVILITSSHTLSVPFLFFNTVPTHVIHVKIKNVKMVKEKCCPVLTFYVKYLVACNSFEKKQKTVNIIKRKTMTRRREVIYIDPKWQLLPDRLISPFLYHLYSIDFHFMLYEVHRITIFFYVSVLQFRLRINTVRYAIHKRRLLNTAYCKSVQTKCRFLILISLEI